MKTKALEIVCEHCHNPYLVPAAPISQVLYLILEFAICPNCFTPRNPRNWGMKLLEMRELGMSFCKVCGVPIKMNQKYCQPHYHLVWSQKKKL